MAARFGFDGFDGAGTLYTGGKALDTLGLNESAGLALRSEKNDRTWLRVPRDSEEWQRILEAMEGGVPFSKRIGDVLFRKGSGLDRRVPCEVTIGRNGDHIQVSMRPAVSGAPHAGLSVTLLPDEAKTFAAMMRADNVRDRYRLVQAQKGKESNMGFLHDSTTASVEVIREANSARVMAEQKLAIRNKLRDQSNVKKERSR